MELLPVEAFDAFHVDDATLMINKEALKGHCAAELVDVAIAALGLLKAEWVISVLIEEGAQKVKWIEVELFESEWHRDVAALIEIRGFENN